MSRQLEDDSAFTIVLVKRYYNLVYKKYGVVVPQDAMWTNTDLPPGVSVTRRRVLQEAPYMLFDLTDLYEEARVEQLVKECEKLRLNSGNMHKQYMTTISTLLNSGLSWGKIVMFFSFSVSFSIYLCTHEMSHLASRVCLWASAVVEDRIAAWVDHNAGWDALLTYGEEVIQKKKGSNEKLNVIGQAGLFLGLVTIGVLTWKELFS